MSNGTNNKDRKSKPSRKAQAKAQRGTPTEAPKSKLRTRKHPEMRPPTRKEIMGGLVRSGPTYGNSGTDFSAWVKLLGNPFHSALVKCPVKFNPVPTFTSFSATTVASGILSVESDRSVDFVVLPGHSQESAQDSMDGEAYHSMLVDAAGLTVAPAPVDNSAGQRASCVFISRNESMVNLPQFSNSYTPIFWDNPLPMTGNSTAGHLRHALVACGVRWKNTTPELNRSGSVKSVQPPIAFAPLAGGPNPGWMGFDRFPSYKLYKGLDGEIAWIPRLECLSYWHTIPNGEASLLDNAGIRILFTAGSTPQTYEYEVICHWELAGSSVSSLSTKADLQPVMRPYIEKAVADTANSAPTASGIQGHVKNAIVAGAHIIKEMVKPEFGSKA